jgi:hypothetical protein
MYPFSFFVSNLIFLINLALVYLIFFLTKKIKKIKKQKTKMKNLLLQKPSTK